MRLAIAILAAVALRAEDPMAILAHRCYACHGAAASGGLRLDSRAGLLKGGQSGAAVEPGNPDRSLVIDVITHRHARLKMPPSGKLPDAEIAALTAWVKDGAKFPENAVNAPAYRITEEQRKFWAFRPVGSPAPPVVKNSRWPKTDLDRFVLSKLEANGLKPVAPADRKTLIRRVTLDLTGLPPTPDEVTAFVTDKSPGAYEKVVDRLLASPRYGERWARHWLDVARYSDDKLDSERDNPYPNSFRYRDWVIQAFNEDMPFDAFVKAQIAGDLLPERAKYEAGLGFYALSPEFQDDRVDATTRGFLGLTVACAQCHDHKFDPIPTQDYYSLLGVFTSTKVREAPLAPEADVTLWQEKKKRVDTQKEAIADFIKVQSDSLAEVFASRIADYMTGAAGLDAEEAERWKKYLAKPEKDHPFLKPWVDSHSRKAAEEFQALVLSIHAEYKRIEAENKITLGLNPNRQDLSQASLKSLERDRYVLWNEMFGRSGVLRFNDDKIDRFLGPLWKSRVDAMRAELKKLEADLPPQYPFLHEIADIEKPHDERVQIRGSRENLGEVAPRRFLAILSDEGRKPFTRGSGRLELAEAIASPANPLTARVFVNRVWQHLFGQGMVRTPSNFGKLGDTPSHPELLDWLARRFMDGGWSVKRLHREIVLSATYGLGSATEGAAVEADPENRLLWRHAPRRLDAEALRDSLLFVAGDLDLSTGGLAVRMTDDFKRRTVYGFVSRRRLDGYLSLFDFPNPNNTSEQRIETNVPLQRLFFMNSELMFREATALAGRLKGADSEKIREAYQLLFARPVTEAELRLGLEFLKSNPWPQYAQALLSANEFLFVN